MTAKVLDFEEALAVVLAQARELSVGSRGTEEVELLAAWGRVLAEDVAADRDQPSFDRATRDGFGGRALELAAGIELRIAGEVRAGAVWNGKALAAGTAIEIMTGAPVPKGADAVVMVEHVEQTEGFVRLAGTRTLHPGDNIVRRGSEARLGQTVILAGTAVGAAEIAVAASCGRAMLPVFGRPRVAIVATGDELVELYVAPEGHQVRNSNSYALAALVAGAGGEAVRLPIARDLREATLASIEAARKYELLILSGGVSMGKYDLVEEVLLSLSAEFFFTGVRMQPGKPVVFGRLPATGEFPALFFFGLPGNPVSTQVTFHVFAAPLIRALSGAGAAGVPFVQATLTEDVPGRPGVTRLLPARLSGVEVRLVGWQGSGDLAANARANCYALLPADRESFRAGEVIRILLR